MPSLNHDSGNFHGSGTSEILQGNLARPYVIRVYSAAGVFQLEAWQRNDAARIAGTPVTKPSIGVDLVAKYFLAGNTKLGNVYYSIVVAERFYEPGGTTLYKALYGASEQGSAIWRERNHAMDPSTGFRIDTSHATTNLFKLKPQVNSSPALRHYCPTTDAIETVYDA